METSKDAWKLGAVRIGNKEHALQQLTRVGVRHIGEQDHDQPWYDSPLTSLSPIDTTE